MFSELSEQFRVHAKNQPTNVLKQYYNDIANALINEDFMQTLSNTEALNQLGYFQNNFDYYISNRSNYNDVLNLVHTGYIAYRADKKRNSQKVRELESKLQESEERISEINRVASILSGAEILEVYANDLDKQSIQHELKAKN